jgi:hypothetical protein
MKLLPYEQGYLDGLCGIYSIINATRLIVKDMRKSEAMKLFGKCMRHVEKRRSLGKVSTSGINESDLWSILQTCVLANYSINIERPFYRDGKISANSYVKELTEYFGEGGKRTAIILIESREWEHWTAIRSITMKRIILFDSFMLKTINVAKCVVGKPTEEKPYLFTPPLTFFLYEK